jgi:hypothetical protein
MLDRRLLRLATIGATTFLAPLAAEGQEAASNRRVLIQVRVVGPDSVALPGVNVAISRSRVGAILIGTTDGTGTRLFLVDVERDSYKVLARRPGFHHVEERLTIGSSDTIPVVLQLNPAGRTDLAAMRIEARPSNYLLTSEQIARSNRTIRDAFEALNKLRPRMLYDRDRCKAEKVSNVWINGRRVLWMAWNAIIAPPPATLADQRAAARRQGSAAIDSTLSTVRSEHLQEIRLVNCWDTSLPGVGSKNALYITLKPGIDWDWKRGSFVADSTRNR